MAQEREGPVDGDREGTKREAAGVVLPSSFKMTAEERSSANPSIWLCGPMDKASAYGAGECRFGSCQGHVRATVTGMSKV